jgi:hypothetical protein
MKLKRISKFIVIFSLCFQFVILDSQESEDSTKQIEKKWGWEEGEAKSTIKKEINLENPVPTFLTQFQPVKQEFPINPAMENIIKGKAGTKITIPANSISLPSGYKRGDILTFELIEIYNDLDFITSSIGLFYFDPNPNIFESAGMFKLSATYYDRPLHLKRGVKLKVEIPHIIQTNRKMKMYKFDEREGWTDKGNLSSFERTKSIEESSDGPKSFQDEGRSFLFNAMDDFKWWNSDYPNPDTTCIEGKVLITEANPPYSVTSVGIDYKNASTRYADGTKFQMNVIKGKKVKLIAMDARGNIGLLKEINAGSLATFLKEGDKGKCTDVGAIEIKTISRDILRDRKKLLNHLGLVDITQP